MFKDAIRYNQSMRNWKLSDECDTNDFFTPSIMWHRYNDENDMPLQNGKKLKVPFNKFKNLWS